MIFGLKNGLTFESQYILSTMTENVSSGDTESLPIQININAIENTQSTEGQHENQLLNIHQTQIINSNLRTPMRVQVEYPDNISRKRRHQSPSQQLQRKVNSENSKSVIEQFNEESLEDDVLLSQVDDLHVNNELVRTCADNDSSIHFGLSDTGRVFARCYTLPTNNSPKKGKVIVYDSDGLGFDSD